MSQNKKQKRKAKLAKAKKHEQLMKQHSAHRRVIQQKKYNEEINAYIQKMLEEKLATIDENGMIVPVPQSEDTNTVEDVEVIETVTNVEQ